MIQKKKRMKPETLKTTRYQNSTPLENVILIPLDLDLDPIKTVSFMVSWYLV